MFVINIWHYLVPDSILQGPSRHDWKIVDWDVKPQHKQNFAGQFSSLDW